MRLPALLVGFALFSAPALADEPAREAAPQEPAASSCAERLAARVQDHYEGVRDLRARFVQTTRSVVFGGAVEGDPARGEVVFAKPGRMRWSYEVPEPSLVVSDGEKLWIYDPTAGEAQSFPVDQGFLSAAALQFLLGEGRILETFHVSAEGCEGPVVELGLVPKREATYERLLLWVASESGAVEETEVVDLFGNRTHVAFRDVETNRDPDPSVFRFEPPEGVSVQELSPP